jgi:hypothetical protein
MFLQERYAHTPGIHEMDSPDCNLVIGQKPENREVFLQEHCGKLRVAQLKPALILT